MFDCYNFPDYELIDFGDNEKLERFGEYILIRPERAALGRTSFENSKWLNMAHARFEATGKTSGVWEKLKAIPDEWQLKCPLKDEDSILSFKLCLTQFKHIGMFPEHASNWNFVADCVSEMPDGAKVLNLFAYTGGGSLAACSAGAKVTHVDSIKQVVKWGSDNMRLSHLDDIRWIVEDALLFVKREVKRGNKYHGVIMDPPTWGRGPKGEHWKLDEQLDVLLDETSKLLEDEFFAVVNTYSDLSTGILDATIREFYNAGEVETKELCVQSVDGRSLPLGCTSRILLKAR